MNPFRTGKLVLFQVTYDRDWHFFEIIFFVIIGIFGVGVLSNDDAAGILTQSIGTVWRICYKVQPSGRGLPSKASCQPRDHRSGDSRDIDGLIWLLQQVLADRHDRESLHSLQRVRRRWGLR